MQFEGNDLVLKTGRRIYGARDQRQAFDNTVFLEGPFTREERKEIASYFIDLWLDWMRAASPGSDP